MSLPAQHEFCARWGDNSTHCSPRAQCRVCAGVAPLGIKGCGVGLVLVAEPRCRGPHRMGTVALPRQLMPTQLESSVMR